jgi:hypothetical protein
MSEQIRQKKSVFLSPNEKISTFSKKLMQFEERRRIKKRRLESPSPLEEIEEIVAVLRLEPVLESCRFSVKN